MKRLKLLCRRNTVYGVWCRKVVRYSQVALMLISLQVKRLELLCRG